MIIIVICYFGLLLVIFKIVISSQNVVAFIIEYFLFILERLFRGTTSVANCKEISMTVQKPSHSNMVTSVVVIEFRCKLSVPIHRRTALVTVVTRENQVVPRKSVTVSKVKSP